MPLFIVRRRIDAYVDYVASVRAPSAKQAAERAAEEEETLKWESEGATEFDARLFITLDDEGTELEQTEVRYF